MELEIQIDEPFLPHVETELIRKAVEYALNYLEIAEAVLTIVITDNDSIQNLNMQYRGVDSPTDVLSFANEPDPDFPNLETDYLGDIIIAYPMAESQAQGQGHTPMAEIVLLAVHGVLHLAGFDHETPSQRDEMWAKQTHIMTQLGLAHIQPTEN